MSLKVRKKKNSSGSASIHIVDRTNRGYCSRHSHSDSQPFFFRTLSWKLFGQLVVFYSDNLSNLPAGNMKLKELLESRIKAHVLISFVSYAIYKEFEIKLKLNEVKFNYSQKFLRKIIEHLIALKIDDEIIPISPSEIQKQILDVIKN